MALKDETTTGSAIGLHGDHGTLLGVSLPLLRRLLAELGTNVTSLWA